MIKQWMIQQLCLGLCVMSLMGCDSDDYNLNNTARLSLRFSHFWDNSEVSNADFNDFKFTTQAGDLLSIERLRYLISDIQLVDSNNQVREFDVYNLVDVTTNSGLSFNLDEDLLGGNYRVLFTFGFDDADNAENYPDLNSANFNVPDMLGGGYHYMQFDGKFINTNSEEQGYNYHTIRAVDISSGAPIFPQDTFFTVDLGVISISRSVEVEVRTNLAEWFKNPNIWELNELNTVLMPNANAQILMYENGQTVFTRGELSN